MTERKDNTEVLATYELEMAQVKTTVQIVMKDYVKYYRLILPEVDVATLALLDDIKERLISGVEMTTSEILDTRLLSQLHNEFKTRAQEILEQELPGLEDDVKSHFVLGMINELLGLDEIEYFLNDPNLEEIVVNSASEPVRVYHKKFGWLTTNVKPQSELRIQNYAATIARRVGREITTLNPLLDAHLVSKDRANAILTPISTKGNTITIRKFARDPWTCTDFITSKTADSEVLALIWLMIQYEMNIIISGGTGSGKTSFLNICMPFIPPNHRIISIEDTRELQLPDYLYWCPLTTREPNPEGKGEVSMLDLIVNALRMRPDRIIMGEIRKKREAEVLFEAMHTGHSVYSTIHADTCEQTITRITNPPIEIPDSMLEAVHLNIVMFRDRRRGIRRIFEVGEFAWDEEKRSRGIVKYVPQVIYRWDARNDKIVSTSEPIRLYTELYRHTGLTKAEVQDDLKTKKEILEWMVKNKLRKINDVGSILNRYYLNPQEVIDVIKKDGKPEDIICLTEPDKVCKIT
ncbi:MAG: type II/IV secretion system ATPase subunit [Candidatus Altiarchaeota archaeon]|nr:type II/IV secretion system ATPase subunit [Candidatus Altiarchaeota archaeon]